MLYPTVAEARYIRPSAAYLYRLAAEPAPPGMRRERKERAAAFWPNVVTGGGERGPGISLSLCSAFDSALALSLSPTDSYIHLTSWPSPSYLLRSCSLAPSFQLPCFSLSFGGSCSDRSLARSLALMVHAIRTIADRWKQEGYVVLYWAIAAAGTNEHVTYVIPLHLPIAIESRFGGRLSVQFMHLSSIMGDRGPFLC